MADLMDIVVEDDGEEVVIALSGTFGVRELAPLREKLERLLSGPGVFFFLDLENSTFLDDDYLILFLDLLNTLKKRKARLVLLFSGAQNQAYFARYSAVFEIAESRSSFRRTTLVTQLRQVGLHYSKQTGLRVTPAVAIACGIILLGWFVTLLGIIAMQNHELSERRAEIISLENENRLSVHEIERLESSIGPLRNLGIVGGKEELSTFGTVRDWFTYLDKLDSLRSEEK